MTRAFRRRFALALLLAAVSAACVGSAPNFTALQGNDGGSAADSSGGLDGGGLCHPNKPFSAPRPVLAGGKAIESQDARLTADEHTLYVSTQMLDDGGSVSFQRFSVASRNSTTSDFDPLHLATDIDVSGYQAVNTVSFTSDGNRIFVACAKENIQRVCTATRTSGGGFAALTPIDLGETAGQGEPYVYLRNDSEIWFSSYGRGDAGADAGNQITHLFKATGSGSTYSNVTAIDELNGFEEGAPVVSSDGLTLFYASPQAGQGTDIYIAHRDRPDARFTTPAEHPAILNASDSNLPMWLSPDGCRLYLVSTRPLPSAVAAATARPSDQAPSHVWVAERSR